MTDLLRQFGWRDLIDILVVAVVLYRLLLIIKGTKAARMLLGILVLLVATVISRFVDLYTLDWLLESFWAYIVIALIVIFQPEIRRTLARMGQTPYLQAFTSAEELRSLEEVVKAVVSLADRKIGALIVLERESDLEDFVELGSALDARVSRELLMCIFHPTSPIHDGAVVIIDNRVTAAGCFLPMVFSRTVSSSLGTRHRAALGLSEETDAVVLIVSEETGEISMALGGEISTRIDMGALRDRLTDLFTTKKVRK
jgi:diadenylate cyclase